MSYHLKCPECGYTIGEIAEFFNVARKCILQDYLKNSEYKDYKYDKLKITSIITPDLLPIFQALSIDQTCTRMHLLGEIKFEHLKYQ